MVEVAGHAAASISLCAADNRNYYQGVSFCDISVGLILASRKLITPGQYCELELTSKKPAIEEVPCDFPACIYHDGVI